MDYQKMEDPPKTPAGFVNLVNLSSPSGNNSPPGHQNSSIIIQPQTVSTSILIHQTMKKHPVVMTCPFCKETVKTKVQRRTTTVFLCCTSPEKELLHSCPSCGAYLGTFDN